MIIKVWKGSERISERIKKDQKLSERKEKGTKRTKQLLYRIRKDQKVPDRIRRIRKDSTWVDCVHWCHPWSSHKPTHGDQVPGIGQPTIQEQRLENGQGSTRYASTGKKYDRVWMRITFGLPSEFVLPFGGSMITRVSIDPPSIWVWNIRNEITNQWKYSHFYDFQLWMMTVWRF